jgi:hypothetical protein
MPVCASGEPDEAAGRQAGSELTRASEGGNRVVFRLSKPFGRLFASRPARERGVRRIAHSRDGRLANATENLVRWAKVEIRVRPPQVRSKWPKKETPAPFQRRGSTKPASLNRNKRLVSAESISRMGLAAATAGEWIPDSAF